MSDVTPKPFRPRTFTLTSSIKACQLRRDDFVKIYKIINDRQIEEGQRIVDLLSRTATETEQEFEQRRKRVQNAFVSTVNITAPNNEIITGSGEQFLAVQTLPDRIQTIFYTTLAGPNAVGISNDFLRNRASLLLDFSSPTPLDFSKLPTHATENNSNLQIVSDTEQWFTTINTHLTRFFDERRSGCNWLHQQGVYDILLLIAGVPFALWFDYRFGHL